MNFTEFHCGKITSNNVKSTKSIVYFTDEPSVDFKELETEVIYYFYTDQTITDNTVIQMANRYFDVINEYFVFNESISHDTYKILAGNDWPSYDDFLQDKIEKDSSIYHEINSYLAEHKKTKINQYIDELKEKVSYLEEVKDFLNSIDKENTVVLTEQPIVYDFLVKKGFKSVKIDFHHNVIGNTFSTKNLPNIEVKKDGFDYNYYCLNHRFSPDRQKVIKALNKYNLIDYGYVKQNAEVFESISLRHKFDGVIYGGHKKEVFDNHQPSKLYNSDWKNHNTYNNIRYSNHVKNLFYIDKNIKSPICLITESPMLSRYLTEKSFQPFHLGRIPLIMGFAGINQFFKEEGFDMFDDIIDYGFDSINDVDLRINTAIKTNQNILKNFSITDNIVERLKYNQNHLMYLWTDKQIDKIVNKMREFLD